jgi:hypothetical protein
VLGFHVRNQIGPSYNLDKEMLQGGLVQQLVLFMPHFCRGKLMHNRAEQEKQLSKQHSIVKEVGTLTMPIKACIREV